MKDWLVTLLTFLVLLAVCLAGFGFGVYGERMSHRNNAAVSQTDRGETPRSGKWPALEKKFLAEHKTCECCGKPATVVHHIRPFHEYPELELVESNLLAVCPTCHLWCHLGDFKSWDPLAREDAARYLEEVKSRPYTKADGDKFERKFRQKVSVFRFPQKGDFSCLLALCS